MTLLFDLLRRKKSSRNDVALHDATEKNFKTPACKSVESKKIETSEKIRVALQFAEGLKRHDVETAFSSTASNCIMRFKGEDVEYTIAQFKEDCVMLFASFPDLNVTWGTIEDLGADRVLIENWQVSGTHTGAPYSFGPFPEVPAKGVKVKNDFERFTLFYTDGIVSKIEVEALGPKTGPPGFYQQIGGVILW